MFYDDESLPLTNTTQFYGQARHILRFAPSHTQDIELRGRPYIGPERPLQKLMRLQLRPKFRPL